MTFKMDMEGWFKDDSEIYGQKDGQMRTITGEAAKKIKQDQKLKDLQKWKEKMKIFHR